MDLSTSIRGGYTLDTNSGMGNETGIKVSLTLRNLTDGQLKTKVQAECNRNTQEFCRLISGQTYANALRNGAKNPERYRPTSEQKVMWTKWCDDGVASIDLATITRANSAGAAESMEAEMARRLSAGESVEDIVADITRRAQEQAESMRTDASDTVHSDPVEDDESDPVVDVAAAA